MANFQFLINIEELIAKYLRGELTEQEHAALQEWIDDSPANKATFDELTNPDRLGEKLRVWKVGSTGKERGWRRIEQRLEGQPVQLWFRLQWTKIAATLLLLILGMGVWFMLREGKHNNEPLVAQKTMAPANDVTPGGFKAKLTLSDGSTIVLDSAINGKLTKQGNTSIQNKDGQLKYTPSNEGKAEELYNTLTTSNGQTYKATLSDGSTVWLNAASSIRYPVSFTGNERRVEITGEVYFEVAHLTPRTGTGSRKVPFIVSFGSPLGAGGEVKVLGTVFNVNAYDEEKKITTTLLEGRVQLSKGAFTKELAPDQQAELLPSGAIRVKKDADIEKAVGWKNGLFVFKGDDVKFLMNQLARWYNVNVVYKGVIKDKFTGIINRNLPVSVVLDMLQRSTAHFQIEGRTITVTP